MPIMIVCWRRSTLYGCMEGVAELGRETINLPANPGRTAREAALALRAREIILKRPKRNHPAEAASNLVKSACTPSRAALVTLHKRIPANKFFRRAEVA